MMAQSFFYNKFLSSINCYSPPIVELAKNYFSFILKKCRLSSHCHFLNACLRKKIIPPGFILKFHPGFIPNSRDKVVINKHLHNASLNLIRTSFQHFSSEKDIISSKILSSRNVLRNNSDPNTFGHILDLARHYNSQFYSSLRNIKNHKFRKSQSSQSGHNSVSTPHSSATIPCHPPINQVVLIPPDIVLSPDETSLLCRGLTFSPTPDKSNLFELHQDHEHFYRRLRLLGHFGPHSGSSSPPSITQFSESIIDKVIPKKSSWTPPPNQFPDLEYFINSSRKALPSSGYSFQSHKSNLSSQELSTIKSLSNRTDIVIRKADKGGSVVVWSRDLYISEANSQLNNTNFYCKLDSDPTSSYQKQVSKTIGNFISSGDLPVFAQRLIEKNPRCSVFYLNPKIHKYGNPGRPIVSTVCCPTSLISAFVDSVLQPLVANTPTYLKDTTHMLQLLENFIFPVDPASCPTFLVTCDVAQLYTVIPHAGGLTAAKVLFESRSVLDPPTHVLIRLLELVLTLNAFEFNSEFFSQISGVAMGTKVGPSYACCFLAHQEFLFFARYSGPMPVLYKRFIDDIFMIFQSPDTDVTIFLDAMSTMHPSLKFETTISSSSICFLDLKISIRDHKILTSIYYKPTDSHSYLPYDSCHPKHVLDSIPYSQFLRLRRICSDDDDFLTQSFTMSQFFSHRGYPSHLIRRTLEAVKAVSRSSLLVPHDKSTKDIVPLVVGYSPNVTTVVQKTKSLFNSILSHNPNFSSKPIVAYRRAPNLQQLLVRSKLKPIGDSILQDSTTFGTFPCNRPRCKTCKSVLQQPHLKINNFTFKIKSSFSCISSSLIYAISCKRCPDVVYIGQTSRKLADRFREHLKSISNNLGTTVCNHFIRNHDIDDIIITALCNAPSDERKRLTLENKIIFLFQSNKPPGLNVNFSFLLK